MDKKKEGFKMYLFDLRENLAQVINDSKLDIDMVYFVMKDLMEEVAEVYHKECAAARRQKELERIAKEEAAAKEKIEEVKEEN